MKFAIFEIIHLQCIYNNMNFQFFEKWCRYLWSLHCTHSLEQSPRVPTHFLRAPSTTAISIATAMCSQIAIAVAVDGLPTHAATDLFNLSQFSDSNNVGPRLWWPNRPPNIRKFWSTAKATAICKSWWWLRLPEPIHGNFGRGCRWKSRLRLKIAVVDGAP